MSEKVEQPYVLFALTGDQIQAIAKDVVNRQLSKAEIERLLNRFSDQMQIRVGWQKLLRQCLEGMEQDFLYQKWLSKVDQEVWGIAGCSIDDLPDFDYHSLFVDGSKPKETAKATLANAGFGQNQ